MWTHATIRQGGSMLSVILKGLLSAAVSVLTKAASKDVMEWLLFYVADMIVKSTKTPHDDAFLEKIKEANDKAKEG